MKEMEALDQELTETKAEASDTTERNLTKETAINPSDQRNEKFDDIFARYGLISENVDSTTDKPTPEQRDDGKFYDPVAGKTYDSPADWEKTQETLAKRYSGAADLYEEKAQAEWSQYEAAEASGASDAEKWKHYQRSQEYYAKAQEYQKTAQEILDRLSIVSENPDNATNQISATEQVAPQDVAENPPIQNKLDGLAREEQVYTELKEKYPESDGYEIISEAYLRDENGAIVKDPETSAARRIDYVVIKDNQVVDSIEVTSQTADKTAQCAKETRIREAGGNYVKDNDGNLVEIPSDVTTRIERRD